MKRWVPGGPRRPPHQAPPSSGTDLETRDAPPVGAASAECSRGAAAVRTGSWATGLSIRWREGAGIERSGGRQSKNNCSARGAARAEGPGPRRRAGRGEHSRGERGGAAIIKGVVGRRLGGRGRGGSKGSRRLAPQISLGSSRRGRARGYMKGQRRRGATAHTAFTSTRTGTQARTCTETHSWRPQNLRLPRPGKLPVADQDGRRAQT